jgi:hypothetical protein
MRGLGLYEDWKKTGLYEDWVILGLIYEDWGYIRTGFIRGLELYEDRGYMRSGVV